MLDTMANILVGSPHFSGSNTACGCYIIDAQCLVLATYKQGLLSRKLFFASPGRHKADLFHTALADCRTYLLEVPLLESE